MFKIAYYETKKMLRDYRLLIVFFLQPIILTYLVANAASHEPTDIKLAVFNRYENSVSNAIVEEVKKSSSFKVSDYYSETDVRKELDNDKALLGAILSIKGQSNSQDRIDFVTNATVPQLSEGAQSKISMIISSRYTGRALQINTEENTKQSINYFSYFASAVMVLVLVMIGISASVTAITQERVDGTFERFFVTPYTKASMIFGKMISYMSISLLLTVVIMFSLKVFFDVNLGNIWLVSLLTFVNGLAAIALGILISSFTYSIEESIQVGTLVFFALLTLTGLIFQPETMQTFVAKLYYAMPFTYAMIGMREINILGFGLSQVYRDILILFGSALVFLLAAVLILRRKAK